GALGSVSRSGAGAAARPAASDARPAGVAPGHTTGRRKRENRMIPLSDPENRRRTFPIANIIFIMINVVVFGYEVLLQWGPNPNAFQSFITAYGVRPYEITTGTDLVPRISEPVFITLVTSMFIHGGWMHIIGNMLYLYIFGDNIEDALGTALYVPFYLVCGLAASAAHILSDPISRIPSVGASGAIAGVLAAYLVFYPQARVNTVILFGLPFISALPALIVIGFWIVIQLVSGFSGTSDGTAYWAHIGGFFAGLALAWPLRGKVRQRTVVRRWSPDE
ncbi:MAG: rhomboid family intramembrane serine protease, partial [Chloroflexi bacterium]|nr:rhomboid family intramembrane serine protease [Chloroflexota bacterium]